MKRQTWLYISLFSAIALLINPAAKAADDNFTDIKTEIAAQRAIRAAGRVMPVNLVLVAEGEEEIGSPHIGQIVNRPDVQSALAGTIGVFMPFASQDREGLVTVYRGSGDSLLNSTVFAADQGH